MNGEKRTSNTWFASCKSLHDVPAFYLQESESRTYQTHVRQHCQSMQFIDCSSATKNNVSDLLCTENAYSQAPSPLPLLTLRIHENVKHIAAQRERCCPSHVPKINDCITFIISNLCAALSVFLTMSCPSFAASINSHQNLLPL